jgi:hypothetical protein
VGGETAKYRWANENAADDVADDACLAEFAGD